MGEKRLVYSKSLSDKTNEGLIFDTHAHYDDKVFDIERSKLILSLHETKGVCNIINVGASLKSSAFAIELSKKFSFIYSAVGIHPECASDLPKDYIERLNTLAKLDKVVAIGEIGLDYHYKNGADKETQQAVFLNQLKLAEALNKPIIVHDRDAHCDTLNILKKYKPKGVVHCFSGSLEMAKEVINIGMYIGLGGVVTFKNARHILDVAKEVPIDKILLETDAPYLAPEPHRGETCNSSMIKYVAEKIAELRGLSRYEVLNITRENAKKLFDIK